MQLISTSESKLSNNQNYCAYLNIIEIPKSIMLNLKMIAPALLNTFQNTFNPTLCYLQIYKEIIFTIAKNTETVITKQKAKLLKKLITIEAQKNVIQQFHDKAEYAFLIENVKWHLKPDDEQKIRKELLQLEQFHLSIYHLIPQKIIS